ncbi:MAG: S41 family peptidase [Treponema sp.]|nr:S41 family peptidase [Treponema sp.]
MNKKYLRCLISFLCVLFCFSVMCFAQGAKPVSETKVEETEVRSKSKENSVKSYINTIYSVMDFTKEFYVDAIDPKILYEGAMKGMMEALNDAHSMYLDSTEFISLKETTSGSFGGVGLTITKNPVNTPEKPAYVEVMSVLENMPGSKAGVQAGDFIIEIDGVATAELTMNEALYKLRGTVGTPVEVTFLRGKDFKFKRNLIRAKIELPTIKSAMIDSVGYIRIFEFTPDTAKRFQEALDGFKKNNFSSLIVDLRNNPGGLLTAAVDVADKFIDSGVIVSTKGRNSVKIDEHKASKIKTSVPKEMPVVVIINKGSASASEILAGALKDNRLAYIVGQNSFGKGSVQQMIPLSETDGFKVTVARYYSPSDSNIDKVGIPPDREIKSEIYSPEQEKAYEKLLEDNAIEKYVGAHPSMDEADIASAAVELSEKYPLDLRTMRRFIRVEVRHQNHDDSEVYDLDYDIQLKAALEIVRNEDFYQLMQTTKDLKQLELERLSESQEKVLSQVENVGSSVAGER